MTREEWRPVVGFEGFYEVSDRGRVRSVAKVLPFMSKKGNWHTRRTKARVIAQNNINSGYLIVHLYKNNKRTPRTVHSLMAAAFFGPRPPKHDVAHNDGNRRRNVLSNLRYATRSENLLDGRRGYPHA